MGRFVIRGGFPLKGNIKISGAKNAALPIIAASLLSEGKTVIEEIPYLKDVIFMCQLIESLGAKVDYSEKNSTLTVDANKIITSVADYELAGKLRASFLVMGPLLARTGYVRISLPGGCQIGSRPVDLHLKGLSAMGAEITQGHGFVEAKVNGRLKGAKIYLDFPSVGATENIIMAAATASGVTIIENAANEPEIVDLATYLTTMGADIKGAGTDTVKITGVDHLTTATHSVIPDRIEAGTFMVAGAMTRGKIKIENVVPEHVKPVSAKLKEMGVEISEELDSISVDATKTELLNAVDIKTMPYPGFPTDMQSQMTSLTSAASGTSLIIETIFENRFMHVCELNRMGANIKVEGRSAIVEGPGRLTGAQVKATDLRAGAALIIAGLGAEGITEVSEIGHIDRGYVQIEKKLQALGADIERMAN